MSRRHPLSRGHRSEQRSEDVPAPADLLGHQLAGAEARDDLHGAHDDHFFAHGHTYEAHPLTLAPAIAAIDEYKRLGLLEHAQAMGEKLGVKLRGLAEKHPSIGDVRGLGLFWALDLVKNRKTKEPFNTARDKVERRPMVVDEITADMMKNGVFGMGWISHLLVAPPLIVTDEQLDEAVAALDSALAIADAKCV